MEKKIILFFLTYVNHENINMPDRKQDMIFVMQ